VVGKKPWFLACVLLHKAGEADLAACFPQNTDRQTMNYQVRSHSIFHSLISEMTIVSHSLRAYPTKHGRVWRAGAGIIGGHFEEWLPHFPCGLGDHSPPLQETCCITTLLLLQLCLLPFF
jgi:hypothetical protein